MKQEHKLYAALGVVLALGIVVWVVRAEKKQETQALAPTAAVADMPMAKLSQEQTDKLTKLVVKGPKGEVTLEKKGEQWEITAPISAKANQQNVKTTLETLQKIEVDAKIASTADVHAKYELEEDKMVRVVAYEGEKPTFDWIFGKSGGRGNMARQGGEGAPPTVYAVKGYAPFNFDRELKNWRHNEIVKFEDANAVSIEIENDNGRLSFTKDGEAWKGALYPRKDGKVADKGKEIERFDEARVKDMLRAFKALRATDFAEEGADTGVSEPLESGGAIVRITMKDDGEPKHVIRFGKTQEGSNRYVAVEGDANVYVVTSWASDFATGGVDKYQKAEEEEGAGGDEEEDDGHGHGKPAEAKPAEAKPEAKEAKAGTEAKAPPKAADPKPPAPAPAPAPAPPPQAP